MPEGKDYIIEALEYINRINFEIRAKRRLPDDDFWLAGLAKHVQVVCENTIKIDSGIKEKYPEVPWRGISDQRNYISHAYAIVDHKEIIRTVKNDLPVLKEKLTEILEKEFKIDKVALNEEIKKYRMKHPSKIKGCTLT